MSNTSRWAAVAIAAWASWAAACGQGDSSSGALAGGHGPTAGGGGSRDGSAGDGSSGGSDAQPSSGDAGDDGSEGSPASSTQALVRIANFAPDAPPAGYDVCLAPAGTMTWTGPLLQMSFPAGMLGQGGANGIQFPWVTAYFPVAPGSYDLQLVAAGGNCMQGLIPATYGLPALEIGTRTTFAVVGDVMPTNNDAALKVTAFADDSSVTNQAALRIINAIPSVGYLDVGTGSATAGTFSPLVVDVNFGRPVAMLPDGGATDVNGYVLVAPLSGVELSAHPSGSMMTNTVTAMNVTLAAGSVTTMALVNGKDGGRPPQFLSCADDAPPNGAQSACTVIP
jgi:hypothetical protein